MKKIWKKEKKINNLKKRTEKKRGRENEPKKKKKTDNKMMKTKNIKQNEGKNRKNRNNDNFFKGWFFKIATSYNKIFVISLNLKEFSNEKSLDYTGE